MFNILHILLTYFLAVKTKIFNTLFILLTYSYAIVALYSSSCTVQQRLNFKDYILKYRYIIIIFTYFLWVNISIFIIF